MNPGGWKACDFWTGRGTSSWKRSWKSSWKSSWKRSQSEEHNGWPELTTASTGEEISATLKLQ